HDSLHAKVNSLVQDVANKRKDLENTKSERTRRELKKTELNEKLQKALNRLQQINYDLRETEREKQQRETLATLKRVFPLVRGRGKQTPGKHWEENEIESTSRIRDNLIAELEALGQDSHGIEDDLKSDLDMTENSLKEAQEQLVIVTYFLTDGRLLFNGLVLV